MANYFYVDSNLGSVGRLTVNDDTPYSSKQTVSMATLTAANTYETIYDAWLAGTKTAPVGDGDFIYVANDHSGTNASAINGPLTATDGVGVHVVSVDTNNVDQYLAGAYEDLGGNGINLNGNVLFAGLVLRTTGTAGVLRVYGSSSRIIRVIDCILKIDLGGNRPFITGSVNGTYFYLINTVFDNISTSNINIAINLHNGTGISWHGGTIIGTNNVIDLFDDNVGGGGGHYEVVGVGLSKITGTICPFASATHDDVTNIDIANCTLNSGLTLPAHTTQPTHVISMRNCDDATGDKLYRFHYATGCGVAKNNDSVHVTDTGTWNEGSDKSSIQVTTTSRCNKNAPFVFKMLSAYANLANTSSDKITINLVTDAALTDTDIAAFLVYPDSTTAVIPKWITSGKTVGSGNYGIDPVAAGTALTNVGGLVIGDWTGASGLTPYTLVLDTNATGQAGTVSVRIEVYTDIGTNVLYIDSDLVVGT